MSKLSKSSSSAKYITRRIRDAEGNIIVKRYKRKTASVPIKIPWDRTPSIISGTVSGAYAYLINQFNSGSLGSSLFFPEISQEISTFFSSLEGIASLFLTGSLAVGLGTFLGWSLLTQGFKVKRWGVAARQLIAISAMLLFTTAIFSSFINEAGIFRHEDVMTDNNDQFDIESLNSPFYDQLLKSLMDLLGPIATPNALLSTITPLDGYQLNRLEDTYLWRYKVMDTYLEEQRTYDEVLGTQYSDRGAIQPRRIDLLTQDQDNGIIRFNHQQQYITEMGASSEALVSPWNSMVGSIVSENTPTTVTAKNFDQSELQLLDYEVTRDINEKMGYNMAFQQMFPVGYFEFQSTYVPENLDVIARNSISYGDLSNLMFDDSIKSDISNKRRTNSLSNIRSMSSGYGAASLPSYYDPTNDDTIAGDATAFNEYINTYSSDTEQSVYGLILQIHNQIQGAILDIVLNPALRETFDATQDSQDLYAAPTGTDRAFYFWDQIKNQQPFSPFDLFPGYLNMLRALDIPSRIVYGFNTGNINEESNSIELYLGNATAWIEALIPWDNNGVTEYSWGIFNPLPNFQLLLEGRFVYGQNSLGGRPSIETNSTSGISLAESLASSFPDELDIDFRLADMNTPFNFGSRVLFEGIPAKNQKLSLTLLNEEELMTLTDGNIASIADAGIDLGTYSTSKLTEGWGNYSILVKSDKTAVFSETTTSPIINSQELEGEYSTFNPTGGEGERNLYAIVIRNGLEVSILVVAWKLEVSISLTNTDDGVPVYELANIPGINEAVNTTFSYTTEELNYNVQVNDLDGLPVPQLDLEILWVSLDDLPNITQTLATGNTDGLSADIGDDSPITDEDGSYSFTFSTPEQDGDQEIYALLAWVPNTIFYSILYYHLSDDFSLSYQITGFTDLLINLTETVEWTINFNAIFTDTFLAALLFAQDTEFITPRSPDYLALNYYILRYSYLTAYMRDQGIANETDVGDDYFYPLIDSCQTNYNIVEDVSCYKLSETNATMGVLSGTTVGDGPGVIAMVGGAVPLDSYYLIVEMVFEGIDNPYYVNLTQRFAFANFGLSNQENNIPHPKIIFEPRGNSADMIEEPKPTFQSISEVNSNMIYQSLSSIFIAIGIIYLRKRVIKKGGNIL